MNDDHRCYTQPKQLRKESQLWLPTENRRKWLLAMYISSGFYNVNIISTTKVSWTIHFFNKATLHNRQSWSKRLGHLFTLRHLIIPLHMYDFHIFITSKPIFLPVISFLLAKTFPSLASVSSDTQHAQDTTNNTKTIERQCIDDFVFFIFIYQQKTLF